jgi:hypothetical protein
MDSSGRVVMTGKGIEQRRENFGWQGKVSSRRYSLDLVLLCSPSCS